MIAGFALVLGFVPCCPTSVNFAYVWLAELVAENAIMWTMIVVQTVRQCRAR